MRYSQSIHPSGSLSAVASVLGKHVFDIDGRPVCVYGSNMAISRSVLGKATSLEAMDVSCAQLLLPVDGQKQVPCCACAAGSAAHSSASPTDRVPVSSVFQSLLPATRAGGGVTRDCAELNHNHPPGPSPAAAGGAAIRHSNVVQPGSLTPPSGARGRQAPPHRHSTAHAQHVHITSTAACHMSCSSTLRSGVTAPWRPSARRSHPPPAPHPSDRHRRRCRSSPGATSLTSRRGASSGSPCSAASAGTA